MNNKHVICVGAACWDTVFQVEQIPAAGVKALALHAVSIAQVFLCVGLANALVTAYVFVTQPEYWQRFKLLLGLAARVPGRH